MHHQKQTMTLSFFVEPLLPKRIADTKHNLSGVYVMFLVKAQDCSSYYLVPHWGTSLQTNEGKQFSF